ncbi:hypothetical protein [Corallococcus sp. CA053C]|uniref:hypothetical protein n=1 Tax=Corallococcus sp. CA053C TaxID=2316732 RepID=UPI0011C4A27A|nr:hypothetical protein [Corallococcus sp. CA053C]
MPFSFESYRNLKQRLGATGALLELNHVAIAELISAAKQSGSEKSYIESRARTHGIHVQSSAFPEMLARISQQSIVVLHAEWEHFLLEFKEESRSESKDKAPWPQKEDGENPLAYTVRSVDRANVGGEKALGHFRMVLMDFFRLARNCAVHPIGERYEDYFEKSHSRITECAEQIKNTYDTIPSQFVRFGIKELILYSRTIKDVALLLCLLARPDDALLRRAVNHKRFNKFNNKERKRNAMIGELCTKYGLDKAEAAIVIDSGAN